MFKLVLKSVSVGWAACWSLSNASSFRDDEIIWIWLIYLWGQYYGPIQAYCHHIYTVIYVSQEINCSTEMSMVYLTEFRNCARGPTSCSAHITVAQNVRNGYQITWKCLYLPQMIHFRFVFGFSLNVLFKSVGLLGFKKAKSNILENMCIWFGFSPPSTKQMRRLRGQYEATASSA